MCKHRFPLSVERKFIYRAFLKESGEILEAEDFKTLYRVTRCHLRIDSRYLETEYCSSEATFEYGYSVSYEISKGRFHCEWNSLDSIGYLRVSTLSEMFYRFSDGKMLCNHVKKED